MQSIILLYKPKPNQVSNEDFFFFFFRSLPQQTPKHNILPGRGSVCMATVILPDQRPLPSCICWQRVPQGQDIYCWICYQQALERPSEAANLLTIQLAYILRQSNFREQNSGIVSLKRASCVVVVAGIRGRDVKEIERKLTSLALGGTHDLSPARASPLWPNTWQCWQVNLKTLKVAETRTSAPLPCTNKTENSLEMC